MAAIENNEKTRETERGKSDSMAEKREIARCRKRFRVFYGVDDVRRMMGISENISERGLFVKSAVIYPHSTQLRIELTTDGDERVVLIGQVKWIKRMSPKQIKEGKYGGMGIQICRFVSGLENYLILCKSLRERYR